MLDFLSIQSQMSIQLVLVEVFYRTLHHLCQYILVNMCKSLFLEEGYCTHHIERFEHKVELLRMDLYIPDLYMLLYLDILYLLYTLGLVAGE